ncbi:MAG: hypothetical protein WBN50_14265, partial [Lutimonas sp.]
ADGLDGVDGVDGMDGINGTTECATCHTIAHKEEIQGKFAMSGHANEEGAWARGASSSWAQCHGRLGYVDYITTGSVKEDIYDDEGNRVAVAYPNTGVMNCKTCHGTHTTFDFENEGYDYALRNFDPVTLVIDEATIIDFGGSSNNCITCHQPRNSYAIPGPTDDYEVSSSRFGPHHGPQSTMLEGIMGANVVGTTAYPVPGSATHRSGSSCVNCHMNEGTAEDNGSHTFNVSLNACTACHESMTQEILESLFENGINGFEADLATLKDLLLAKGAITASGSTVSGVWPANVAQATWNYKTLDEDQSKGVHNPAYTRALLKNSIEALQN